MGPLHKKICGTRKKFDFSLVKQTTLFQAEVYAIKASAIDKRTGER
jgi:hypothetical protein